MDPIARVNYRNARAPGMWRCISARVDFNGKSVIDFGCGYGDFAELCRLSDADSVICVDKDEEVIQHLRGRFLGSPVVKVLQRDIETIKLQHYDIGFCFSVLPYLEDPDRLLERMANRCSVSFIECQYYKDGPGPAFLKDDTEMEWWLRSAGFESIESIGHTVVDYRNAKRTIWMCSQQKSSTDCT